MELINRKYRIIRPVEEKQNITAYLVYDVAYPNKPLQLTIIEPREQSFPYIYNLYNDFICCQSFKGSCFLKDLELDRIINIDGRVVDTRLLFLVSEFAEDVASLKELLNNTTEVERLELFIGLCRDINYYYAVNGSYPKITLDSALFCKVNGAYTLKYKSLGHISFFDDFLRLDKTKSKEIRKIRACFYELGLLLLMLFDMDINVFAAKDRNILNEACTIKSQIAGIAGRMMEQKGQVAYRCISDIMEDFNKLFNKFYTPYELDRLKNFKDNIRLVGRDGVIKNVIDIYEQNSQWDVKKKLIFIHGNHGIGKTHILNQLKDILNIKGINVYYSFELETEADEGNIKSIIKILKSIMAVSEKSLLKEYEQVLIKIMPELNISGETLTSNNIWDFHSEEKLIAKVLEFIYKSVKDSPSVIMFDNIDYACEYSIDVIKLLINNDLLKENVLFIFSYSDDDNSSFQKKLSDIIQRNKNDDRIVDIALEGLSREDCLEIVSRLLPTGSVQETINNKVYQKSMGNPKYIQEIVKNFYQSNILTLNEDCGGWIIKDNLEEKGIPDTIEAIAMDTINQLGDKEINLLGIISVFNIPISTHILQTLFGQKNIHEILVNMVNKGILSSFGYNEAMSFKISDRIYKNIIYNMIGKPNRKIIHGIAAQVLEGLLSSDRSSYFQELLYHLEKAENYHKAIMYYIQNADLMDKYKNRSETIRSLENALRLFEAKDRSIEKVKITLRLGEKYIEVCKYDRAMELYTTIKSAAKSTGKLELYIDALIGIIRIQIVHHDIKKASKNIKLAEEYLKKVDYLAGYLNVTYRKAYILNMKREYKAVIEIVQEILPLCKSSNIGIKGDLYSIMGLAQSSLGLQEFSLESFLAALECYEANGMVNNQMIALTNIGGYYAIRDDIENFGKYLFKSKKLNEIFGHDRTEVILDLNLSSYYFTHGMYEECIELLRKVTPLAKKLGLMTFYNIGNVFLLNINIRSNNLKEAYYYFQTAGNEIEKEGNQGSITEEYYFYAMLLFFEMGSLKRFNYYSSKIVDGTNVDLNINEVKAIYTMVAAALQKNNIEKNGISEIIDILKKESMHEFELTFVQARIAMLLYDAGWTSEALEILESVTAAKGRIHNESIIAFMKRYIYLSHSSNIIELIELLQKAIAKNYNYLVIKIRFKIADLFYREKQFNNSIYYYIDAYRELKDFMTVIPQESQMQFLKIHSFVSSVDNFYKAVNLSKDKNAARKKIITSYNEFEQLQNHYSSIKDTHRDVLLQAAKAIQRMKNNFSLNSFEDLVGSILMDADYNLSMICNYIASELVCSRVVITSAEIEDEGFVLGANTMQKADELDKLKKPNDVSIFKAAGSKKSPIAYNCMENSSSVSRMFKNNPHIKAAMCIPILIDSSMKIHVETASETGSSELRILGYLYMESYNEINGLYKENLNSLNKIYKILALNMQKLISDKAEHKSMQKDNETQRHNEDSILPYELNPHKEKDNKQDLQKLNNLLSVLDIAQISAQSMEKASKIVKSVLTALKGQFTVLFEAVGDSFIEQIVETSDPNIKAVSIKYNKTIIDAVIKNKSAFCGIDWDIIAGFDDISGTPYWNSVIAVPVMDKSNMAAKVLYIAVPMDAKKFSNSDMEYAQLFANLL